jgi:hypothetical protein
MKVTYFYLHLNFLNCAETRRGCQRIGSLFFLQEWGWWWWGWWWWWWIRLGLREDLTVELRLASNL